MRIVTPKNLHYPITVTRLLRQPQEQIDYNAPLFTYQYKTKVLEGDEETREAKLVERLWPSTFESTAEGTLTEWHLSVGRVITGPGIPIVDVEEACKHEVQFGNLCADCGKDMTTVSYNTVTRDTARATVNAVHGHTSLLVSTAEASKSDEEAKRRLLSSRKLSLVVDLDQTIIQATVDPTVAEWQKDPQNPNYPAVKDVRAFQLIDDGPGARGCWYYIKLRPGLEHFLSTISKYFELHIYTMGTRTYAQSIAKIVDPDRKIFADRILSRDESGSLTVKNLKRLFPVDTKMVVIIDDRGDVWHWCHNLVKVTPYDFFVGIGDINSSFLPKRPGLEPSPSTSANSDASTAATVAQPATSPSSDPTGNKVSAIDQLVSMGGGNDPTKLKEQTSEQGEAISAQLTDRPLLQKQKVLDAAEEDSNGLAEASSDNDATSAPEPLADVHNKYRHNLLQDNDDELHYLQRSLQNVHSAFFQEYDRKASGPADGRVAELRTGPDNSRITENLGSIPDVTSIMAAMKLKVLRGVHLVFSGVMPLGVQVQNHDFAIWAKSFGATVSENITKRTSHVVSSPLRKTAKVRQAAKKPDKIKIVSQDWLFACLVQWQKIDEAPFRLHADLENEPNDQATNGQGSPFDGPDQNAQLSSSDEEAAVTEDEDSAETSGTENDTDAQEQAELERYMPTLPREQSTTDYDDSLAAMHAELYAEGIFDGDSDTEGSVRSEAGDVDSLPPSANKRKRSDDDQSEDNDDESDSSLGSSRLERRKKKALARTTSLVSVSAVDDAQRVKAEAQAVTQQDTPADTKNDIVEDEDEDDLDLEAQMEAEMLRQAEEEGYP
ncbi:hypothetical protein AUEXF2481DRAFT_25240 [Aureobasidium subglaciale EXF-2481]|uniref:RNA polymerase II subunit A C-terminal domain phosphatase n=1 Tax=Aureobasidium subglaciale (strain EXF-2481) TaxID=1043005 RepID=A0A074YNP8_AURSE|nr:uncharacterized protein AUEXF2481DRAFT_25240 [Aureobasidium subglaciale EXF-2481]KAI5201952.1 hypothetical protein E4T38_05818 [Aureobasidium subglaciale]KAI5220831.1 hypothetical protein E4T40_05749 [Aureobasidium subglaciale]KAI5224654.1 hypothetical protein E4T41_05593 [Aureobasidium subglaciale]KAI5260850.1 hypothetical protein E4T46_05572 [Aureobasidium subglaciale]KEQ99320.1 hypothetical protein AUEXF2481DRAFT_25240 [Aureobasidium subglaciale EXF-2481]